MMRQPSNRLSAFTLLELLLYVGLVAIIALSASGFVGIMLQDRAKNQAIAEVEQNGMAALGIISRAIRGANGIVSPTAGTAGASLTLTFADSAVSPTVVNLSGPTLRMSVGAGSPVEIVNNRVAVTNLRFNNATPASSLGAIRVEYTVSAVNATGRSELNFSRRFATTASLRQ